MEKGEITRFEKFLFENIVTKEEIAQNKQFLLLPQCFPLFQEEIAHYTLFWVLQQYFQMSSAGAKRLKGLMIIYFDFTN